MSAAALPRIQVLAAATLFSSGGALIKSCSLDGTQIAAFRSLFAAAALLVLLPAARRAWSWRTALVGIAYASTLVLFVQGNKLTTAANTIFLQSTAPLYVLVLSPLLLRERIRLRDIAFMAALAAGMAMFFVGIEEPLATAPDPVTGNVLAACAGLTWALTLLGLRWLGRTVEATAGPKAPDPALAATAVGNLIACAVCIPWALPVVGSTAQDWVLLVVLGVFQIGMAYALLTRGVRRVPALELSLLLLLEPVLNPLWAWLVHDELPGRWAFAGATTILLATGIQALTTGRRET